jgi:SAM-dependent methyltransferase
MRKVFRDKHSNEYWENRWSSFENDKESFQNMEMYPIKFVERFISKKENILDAGCGLGRIVKHYHNNGFNIRGCELSQTAVKKLKKSHKDLKIEAGSITHLPYKKETFDLIVAFGVIHSIESIDDITKSFLECHRCLLKNGNFIFSARADNWENYLIDKITELRGKKGNQFHKWCFSKKELDLFCMKNSFEILNIELVTNVPFLYKFKIFRKNQNQKESELREKGFQINIFAKVIYKILKILFQSKFGTTYVYTTKKL